ncbi:MAG: hypothetical protein P8I94_01880 [Emcibacteraceae bacterium]|nr:hypothetical protein [Emcibacteraceae bacterium]
MSNQLTAKQFKRKLFDLDLNQSQFASIINVSNNTVTSQLKRDNISVLYSLAIIGLESINKGVTE